VSQPDKSDCTLKYVPQDSSCKMSAQPDKSDCTMLSAPLSLCFSVLKNTSLHGFLGLHGIGMRCKGHFRICVYSKEVDNQRQAMWRERTLSRSPFPPEKPDAVDSFQRRKWTPDIGVAQVATR
jgi:hypothetical protein